jgi:NAD(P)-dependent dehydrogenase (short-subunit alcohol dehydrogenase family)
MSTTQLWSLAGKTVAITGGARGIGVTLAMAVVESGGNVACLDILSTPAPVEWAQLQELASAHKAVASYHHCDVTDEKAVEAVMELIAADADAQGAPFWGTIACAGIQQMIPALEYPTSDFERILRVNVTGVFNTCKHAARMLRRAKRPGSIVIIASMSGNIANRVGVICMQTLLLWLLMASPRRDSTARHTTPVKPLFSKCADRSLRNGESLVFE